MTEDELKILEAAYNAAQAAERSARDQASKARANLIAARVSYANERLLAKGIAPMETPVIVSADHWRGGQSYRVKSPPVFVAAEGDSEYTASVRLRFYEMKKDGKPSSRKAHGPWVYGENQDISPVAS